MVILSPFAMPSIQVASVCRASACPGRPGAARDRDEGFRDACDADVIVGLHRGFVDDVADTKGASELAAAWNPNADIEARLALGCHVVRDDLDDRGFFGGRESVRRRAPGTRAGRRRRSWRLRCG